MAKPGPKKGALVRPGIYLIENRATGCRYVGSAINIDKRWKEHRRGLDGGYHHSRRLMRSWRKRGPSAFVFRPLLFCDVDMLLFFEQRAIDTMRPEYNSSPTAASQLGVRRSDETKAKNAEAARRTKNFQGRRHSEETKARISAAKTGVKAGKYSLERVEKTAAAMRASKDALTEEHVRQIRRLKAEGMKHADVAAEVGAGYWAVSDVCRGRTFGWVK